MSSKDKQRENYKNLEKRDQQFKQGVQVV